MLLKIFRFLWTGSWHEHRWQIIDCGVAYDRSDQDGDELETGTWYHLQCKHCGDVKKEVLTK